MSCSLNRVKWMDGLKGIACVCIFVHHFLLQYFPSTFSGEPGTGAFLSQLPFAFLINGNFFVFLFLVISGYLMAKKVMNMAPASFGVYWIKRYINLCTPLLINDTILWALYFFGVKLTYADLGTNPSFWLVIKSAMIRTLWLGDMQFVGAYWMLNYIFMGGLFVAVLASITWSGRKKLASGIAIAACAATFSQGYYYNSIIILGGVFGLLEEKYKDALSTRKATIASVFAFTISMFFAAYPSGIIPTNIYSYFILPFEVTYSFYHWHWLAAALMFLSISNLKYVQAVLEQKWACWLGGISYIFYAFHTLFTTGFDPVLNILKELTGNDILASLIDVILILVALLAWCVFYKKYINSTTKKFLAAVKL